MFQILKFTPQICAPRFSVHAAAGCDGGYLGREGHSRLANNVLAVPCAGADRRGLFWQGEGWRKH